LNRRVSVSSENETIDKILDKVFTGTDVEYIVNDRQVIVRKKNIMPAQIVKAAEKPHQEKFRVHGIVTDSYGEPLVGATVLEKGNTSNGTISDINGEYNIEIANPNGILVFGYVGHKSLEKAVNSRNSLNVVLEDNATTLDELVVTALNIKKDRRALPYALGEIKAEELTTIPTQGLSSSLYGKVAGMQVASTSGGQMGGTKIQLRGVNSIAGSNRPLIVVDGIPVYDDDTNYTGRDRDQTQESSALNDINPDDIESISVLKGANAAALYGSRATNGVIVITTKKGTTKKGLGIEVSSSYTYNQMVWMPEYQNEFGVGTQPFFNTNSAGQNILQSSSVSWGPAMDGTNVLWWDGVERPFVAQPDNMKDLFQDGFNNNNSISITSGGEKSSMRVSYANNNYEGFLNNMTQTRHNFNFSGTTQLSSWLTVNASMSYNRNKNINPGTRIDRISNFPMPRNEITALYKQHYKTADGYFMTNEMRDGAEGAVNGVNANLKNNVINYLLWEQNENRYTTAKDRYLGNISTNIKIIDPLSIRLSIGTDRIYTLKEDKEMHKQYSDPADATSLEGMYRKINKTYIKNFYEAMVMFDQKLSDKFNLSIMGAFSSEDIKESSNKWQSNGLKINGMFSASNNKGNYLQSSANKWVENESEVMYAVYGSGQLAYNSYLYLDITARNDWSSRLPSYSRSFFYPSFGLGFVFSDAFKVPEWLTYGKLRGSYAIVGNYTPERYFANILYTQSSFDDRVTTNSFSSTIPPVSIDPEKTHSLEFGTELKLFGGRIGIDFTYFANETRNQILSATIPVSTGGAKMSMNAGTVQSKGVELQLTGRPVETKNFTWSSTLNLSRTKSTLEKLSDGLEYYQIGNPWSVQFRALPGDPIYGIYIRKWQRDDNGNMIVGSNGRYIQDTEYSYMGDAMPKVVAGFSNTFQYKNFSLSVMLDGQFGGKLVSFTNSLLKASGVGKESLYGRSEKYGGLPYYMDANGNRILLDSHSSAAPDGSYVYHDGVIAKGVKEDGTKNDIVISSYNYHYYKYNGPLDACEDLVRKNTYIKVRELNFTYNMPKSIYSKFKLQGLSLSLIGSNLFYVYKSIPNVSPESGLGTSSFYSYVEYSSYPSERNFGFSVKAKF
jgi:iron complex outermembrane receptor protein